MTAAHATLGPCLPDAALSNGRAVRHDMFPDMHWNYAYRIMFFCGVSTGPRNFELSPDWELASFTLAFGGTE